LTITPKIAGDILANMAENRPLSSTTVERYKNEMLNGAWLPRSEPLKFDTHGRLVDGQHRLWAVIESGTTQEFIALTGLPSEAFMVLDTGKKRSFKDILGIKRRDLKNLLSVAAATNHILRWERGWRGQALLSGVASNDINHNDLWDFYERNEAEILEATSWGMKMASTYKAALFQSTFSTFAWAILRIDREDAEDFMRSMLNFSTRGSGDPIHAAVTALRSEMVSDRKDQRGTLARLIKGWNGYRKGIEMHKITWRPGGANAEQFPEPI